MKIVKIQKYIRWLVYILELVVFYALYQAPGFDFAFLQARPLLLIPAFISIALFEKEFTGMAFGIFTGFLLDMNLGNILGVQAILLCMLGYSLGVVSNYYFRANFFAALISAAAIIPLVISGRFYFYYISHGIELSAYAFVNYCVPSIILTFTLMPLVFFFNRAVAYFLRGEKGGGKNKAGSFK